MSLFVVACFVLGTVIGSSCYRFLLLAVQKYNYFRIYANPLYFSYSHRTKMTRLTVDRVAPPAAKSPALNTQHETLNEICRYAKIVVSLQRKGLRGIVWGGLPVA